MIYTSSAYKNDIESLIILFTALGEPEVAKSPEPKEEMKVDEKGNIVKGSNGALIMIISKFEEVIYNERIK